MMHTCVPGTQRHRQEDHGLRFSLGYKVITEQDKDAHTYHFCSVQDWRDDAGKYRKKRNLKHPDRKIKSK